MLWFGCPHLLYSGRMVKRSELRVTTPATRQVASAIRDLRRERGVSLEDLMGPLKRSRTYVADRDAGLESWTLDELVIVGRVLGFRSFWELMDFISTPVVISDPPSNGSARDV